MIASRFHGMDALKGSAAEDLHYGLSTGYGWISEYRSRRFQKAFSRKIRMRPIRTITARLSGVFLSLLLLVILLGLFSIASLRHFNGISSQVQERWLPSTRALGDLNNFTSDFRAAEAATLLAVDSNELATRVQEMADLDRVVSKAQRDYSQTSHDATEQALYARLQLEIAPLARIELHIEPQTLLMVADAKLLSSLQQPVFLVSSLRFEVFNG